jgi:DNA repair exonuclease SbcCD nuclease subunit
MERLLIAQLSDFHLGASLRGGRLALPAAKAGKRRDEQRQCLQRFADHVRGSRPNLVLLPGDLFDSGEPDVDDLNFVITTVNSLAPTPVFVTPGNHDGYAASSCYNPHSALSQSRGRGPKWGSHVHIFASDHFETVPLHHRSDATVTGAAFHRHTPESRHALADLARPPENGLHLLLFHGALQNYPRPGAEKEVLPFTTAELERAGYAYAAVGHYHHGGAILSEGGQVLGAYAGAPFAASLMDEDVGTWLDVELIPGEPLTEQALDWRRCDDRAIRRIEMDVSGPTDTMALAQRLEEQLTTRGATPRDLVCIVLRGRLARGITFNPQAELRSRFFHAVVDDAAIEPDYAIDFDAELPEEPGLAATSEEVLRWKMLKEYHKADSDERRALVREALIYGLDALTLGEIHLR